MNIEQARALIEQLRKQSKFEKMIGVCSIMTPAQGLRALAFNVRLRVGAAHVFASSGTP